MAEIVRIDGGAETPATPSLPQNVEAEAALLGALMIDNRLVEDIQLKLKPHHFFEPLHGRIYEAILRMTDKNMVANPVTLRPIFEADEAMKEVGGPAYLAQLTGSGAAIIGARDFADADLRSRPAAGPDRGRPRDGRGRARHQRGGRPAGPDRAGRDRALPGRRRGRRRGQGQAFGEATRLAVEMAERALNSGGHLSGVTTGLDGINSKIGGLHRSRSDDPRRAPRHGQDLARHQHRLLRGAALLARSWRTGSIRPRSAGRRGRLLQPRNVGRPARHPHPRRAVRDQLRESAHGQDQPAGIPQPRARRGRAAEPAALHRRHARADHRRACAPAPAA